MQIRSVAGAVDSCVFVAQRTAADTRYKKPTKAYF